MRKTAKIAISRDGSIAATLSLTASQHVEVGLNEPRARDAKCLAVAATEVALEDVLPTPAAPALVEGPLGTSELERGDALDLEHVGVRSRHDYADGSVRDIRRNLGGLDASLTIGEELLLPELVLELGSESDPHRAAGRDVKDQRHLSIPEPFHHEFPIGASGGDHHPVRHAGLWVAHTDLHQSVASMILDSRGPEFPQRGDPHPMTDRHEWATMSVKLPCPLGRFHD